MRRARQLAALIAAISTLGVGLTLPPVASAEESGATSPAISTTGAASSTTASSIATANTTKAAADPIASFDFNADPTDGVFADAGKAKATVNGTANLVASKDAANGKAAQLGQNFWMNVTKSDGSPLLAGLNDVTISYDSKATATGGQWTVFAAPSDAAVNGNAPTYLGVLDRTDKTRVERYLNGRNNDTATIDQNAGTAGNWKHVDLVISGTTAKLYVDKKFVASNVNGEELKTILGGSGGVLQIGKGNWGNGEYFTGLIDNLNIYGSALSATDLGAAVPSKLHIDGNSVADDGTLSLREGSSTTLSTSVEPSSADPTVTWESDNPAVAKVSAAGKVTAVKAGTATITVTSEAAPTVKATLKVTVETVKADDAYGYAMVHFIENNKGYAEKIYLDISRGDDATQWDTLNGGQPILANNESTTGVRDPFIAYNPESKTYYILATDLRVFGGDNAGWGTWSTGYSTKLHVWESKDLIHFNDMTELETATEDAYTKNPAKTQTLKDTVTGKTISDIGMAWAPEATWVPNFYDLNDDGIANGSDKDNPKDQQGGAFVMYWSTSAKYDGENNQPGKKVTHVLWAATKDFTNATYQFGGVFVPNSKYRPGNTIDTTMIQRTMKGDDGSEHLRSYRTTGSGTIFMEYTDRADWWRANDNGQYATDPAQGWVLRQNNVGHTLGSSQEGANGFKVNGQDKWYMFVDNYGSVASGARYGYNLLESDDLDAADGNVWKPVGNDGFFLTANTKHGGVVSLTKAQYDAIRAADAKASDNQNLTVADEITVGKNATADDVKAALPATQKVTLANGYGTADRDVTWDVSKVDTAKDGTYTVKGTVDTIGAAKNHWKWTNAAGDTKTDEDDLINEGVNANNSWKQTGGFVDNATAQKNRPLYSSTAITVTAKVKVGTGATTPTNPDLLADFTFDTAPADGTFDGGNATGATQGTATLADSKDDANGKAAKLSKDFWLNVTAKDGSPLLKGKTDVTISYDVKPDAANNTGWTFFAASDANKQEYGKEHYVGVLDKTTGITVERYDNNSGSRDSSGNIAITKTNTGWKHVDIVISGKTAELYVDQKLTAVNTTGKTLTDILGETGGILQIGKANWGNGEYFSGLLDNLKIYGKALSDDDLGVEGAKTDYAAALAIPARITGDLPSTVLGKKVTWKAAGDGAKLVAADGKVTLPKAGSASVKVTLTATIDGVATPITADATILDNGGAVASYVKDVDRSDPNGAKYDPLAYNDDRRADSLYVAAKAADAEKWTPLNRSQSILSVKWDGSQSAKPNAQMGSPTFFRNSDGKLGVVSSQNNATGAIYVWDVKADGATFTNERAITVSDSSVVTDPRIVYDAAAKGYKVYWTDGLSGEGRVATLSDLTKDTKAGEMMKADAVAMGVGSVTAGLPAWAGSGQTSAFTMSKTEYDAFYRNYVDLQNTGRKDIADVDVKNGTSVDDVTKAVSGKQATMTYNDGSEKTFNVTWNADDLAKIDTSKAGTYEVKGTVDQTVEAMVNDARADPDIFYNEDDGYYYLTGSTYEVKSTDPTMA
ncbi:LamG-like jellyroll fold domain-containing protein [Bifidobacterium pluvialisilvae]|uniref:LamG-like jellyroll fold domain-containing protein n=1 Tax=Bifidobacterium pluvialisilvae TaxID=2834436 RepID=UPI001F370D51|nr:LamG-like jellyroll fold domain-containing protein [Bifidobacterium pluvialisilvae]